MAPVVLVVPLLLVLVVVYKTVNLVHYIRLARATGLPYVITPVLETEIIGLLATPILRTIYHNHLNGGKGWPKWCRFIIKDWSWEDKRLAHDELGDVFLCVSPEGIICYSADAAMGWDVMNRRYDFTKPPDKYKILEPYGPNVATAEGATYRFHVRITAPPFGDMSGANELVWMETLYQTRLLSEAWSQETPRELQMDVNSLTLAVISLAGFGRRVNWTSNSEQEKDIPRGYKMSFLKAINDTTANMVPILMLPGWLLNLTPLREAHVAHAQLDKYLREMIRVEKRKIGDNADYQSTTARGNLLTAVLRAATSEAQPGNKKADLGRKEAFTEDEVMGNLFIYLLAGYETTANAITYGLITLALRNDIQDKIVEEIDAIYVEAASAGRSELTYGDDFEKLRYTYGFMYETFRLFPGVTLITKMATKPQAIVIHDPEPKTHILPTGTRVYLSAPGVHYNEKYWPDPYKLDPHRWDTSLAPKEIPDDDKHGDKRVVAADKTRHMRGTLLTFSDGSRACLGRKFAQAEYVAFLAALLRDYRVQLEPGQNRGEIERDLYLKSAGKVTLAPLGNVRLGLEKRRKN
ncbi:cytochrome P450 [Glonium stellatum]|uniref:Cytochrome P450 n=1 Tax=Glonium stellatum TaxID=574774 RepID=A0A8E2JR07_9PEZI|nr:cytochrome P450 [Glonium stellatum]